MSSQIIDIPAERPARLAPVCILAGGLGTRLGDLVAETPKALIEVAGEPFLLHQLRALAIAGAGRVVLCVGHLGDRVEQVVGDGADLGLEVLYAYDGPALLGTAGAVRGALGLLGDHFLILYGDTFLQVDYADVERRFLRSGRRGLMTVLRNHDRWDASNAVVDHDTVTLYDKTSRTAAMQWIDYGLGVLRADALAGDDADLASVYARLAADGQLAAYEVAHRFYEIGAPAALAETDAFLRGRD